MKEKGKKKGFTFNKMCLLLGLVPMLTLALFLSVLALLMVSTNIKEGIESSLQIAASNVAQYFEYDIVNNGDVDYDEYSDHVFMESQQGHDVELTLYRGNVRFLTSLKNTDGTYSEGSLMPDDVWAYLSKGDDYYVENYPIYGENYFAYYVPIFDDNGEMWGAAFAGKHVEKYQERLKTSVRNLILIAGFLTIVFICVVLFVASLLSKIVSKVENSLNELSAGDLNADFSYVAKVTEFKHLVDCGRNLEAKLNDIIGSAKETAGILNETASTVDNLSKNSADGADQISEAVIELSTTAQSMAETVQDANSSIIEMGDIIDVITDSVSTMVEHAKETSEATDKAVSAMAVLEKASEKSTESIDSIRSQIKETYDAVDEIRTAADAIASISSETNLLALNASIEAARAGEAGRGFAVVAENIKKLAEESNQSAGQIQDIINHIISVSEKSVQMADEVGVILEEQKKALDDAYTQMDESKHSNIKLGEGVDKVGTQAEALSGIKEAVLTNISDLSAISQENAASSEEVNASVENISGAIKTTKDEASLLSEISDTLIEKMSFFK